MMTFDPEAWLEVAEVCCDTIPGVVGPVQRSAQQRLSVYAALLSVKRRIERVHGRDALPRSRTHAAIIEVMRSGGDQFTEIYKGLQVLRTLREGADYQLGSEPLLWHVVHAQVRFSSSLIRRRIKALSDAEFRALPLPPK